MAVADAIRDHYKPVGQGDDVPTAPVTVCVALADKLDTLAGFFFEQEKPTGSRDPYALRRAAVGAIQILLKNTLRVKLVSVIEMAVNAVGFRALNLEFAKLGGDAEAAILKLVGDEKALEIMKSEFPARIDHKKYPFIERNFQKGIAAENDLFHFFADRLKVQKMEAGVRHDLIDAVFALGGEDDLVRLLARVHALQAFVTTDDGKNLLAGYKRAANILKAEGKKGWEQRATNPAPEPAEVALIAALGAAEPQAAAAIAAEDFAGAMAALASLRAPIDAFFEQVTVNADEPNTRAARLGLLNAFRAAVHKVADFSRIEG